MPEAYVSFLIVAGAFLLLAGIFEAVKRIFCKDGG